MESIKYLKEIEKISIDKKYLKLNTGESINLINTQNHTDCFIEAAFGAQVGLMGLFDARNVPDELGKAYHAAFTNMDDDVYSHYLEMIERGDDSVSGFVSILKGKYFELNLTDQLSEIYQGFEFAIPADPTMPVWDIIGINGDGEEIFIQAKMWTDDNWSKLADIMNEHPDVLYATSNEVQEKIIEKVPELADQFVPDIDYSNFEFTEKIGEELDLLVKNMGIDVPDGLEDLLPYVKELVLGIKLLIDLTSVQRDLKRVNINDKSRIAAIKVIVLFARYGVTYVLSAIGAAAGGAINPLGIIPGGIFGVYAASQINKEIMPYLNEILIGLLKMNPDDMFYYSNKKIIDYLATRYISIDTTV